MITKSQISLSSIFSLFTVANTHQNYYYYENEDDLAAELSAPRPDGINFQSLPEIDADEFEHLYTWFLS